MDSQNQPPKPHDSTVGMQKLEQDLQNLEAPSLQTPDVPTAPITPPPQEVPQQPKTSPILITSLVLAIIAVLALVAYIFGMKYFGQKPIATPISEISSPSPIATTDPTANWKTYTSSQYNFSFRYPDKLSGTQGAVAGPYTGVSKPIREFSDPSTVREGTDASFDGFSLYIVTDTKASSFENYVQNEKLAMDSSQNAFMSGATRENLDNGAAIVNSSRGYYYLKSSDNKTIIVFAYIQTNDTFRTTFNQILSTFKFLGSTSSTLGPKDATLDLIKTLTPGVIWSEQQTGTIVDAKGKTITGTLIKTTDSDPKIKGKIGSADNSPLVQTYGWVNVPDENGDAVDGSIVTMTKTDNGITQKIIIRWSSTSGYTVLITSI